MGPIFRNRAAFDARPDAAATSRVSAGGRFAYTGRTGRNSFPNFSKGLEADAGCEGTTTVPKRATLAREIAVSGIALHAGTAVRMVLAPAPAGTGVVFRRADLGDAQVAARYDLVGDTRLGTVIADGAAKAGVVEHLMAAVAGIGIDDLLVTLDGPEPPILDGDALCYLDLLEQAGRFEQPMSRDAIKVLKPVTVAQGEARASLTPAEHLTFDCEIDFPTPAIGRQRYSFAFSRAAFRTEIAPARTFGFLSELEALNKMNLARGASLDNTLALSADGVVNRARMRFADEFVRHKILDAIGDMALAGAPLIGRFEGVRSGHAVNNALLRALFSDPVNFQKVPA
jgi:UDP-3-O-[3-hydroxymyristoyl] N-acetylglucosamine deacetylase